MENLVQDAIQNVNLAAVMPSLVLCCFGMAILLMVVFLPKGKTAPIAWLSLASLVITGFVSLAAWGSPETGFYGAVQLDNFATFFNLTFILAGILTILMSEDYLQREGYPVGEYYPLILFIIAGAMWMASGTDLITIFLGLEVLSISLYVLAGFFRGQLRSNEAGLKYFLLGSFSTAFLLYGMALVYGATGTTNLAGIAAALQTDGGLLGNPLMVAGMVLMSSGFLFKIAAVPFHMWTPDVYHGAPTPVTAFMSAGPKAAAFAAFMRVFMEGLGGMADQWTSLLWVLAVLTMVIGNVIAIAQTNIKRMLAYSSVAHAGYALVGMVAFNEVGTAGILFYMLAYTFMNLGAFAILVLAGKKGEDNLTLDGFAGFGYRRPMLGVAMAIFLFSLMGLPPTAGFAGKFYIFAGAVQAGYIWLAIIGVLASAVSLYYYLRVMVYMYFRDPVEDFAWVKMPMGAMVSIVIALVGVLLLGILPSSVMDLARLAIF
ncbi:NADH-quinone oxidoreductase subunit N [Geoalkalibacter halelectricus]|uniref:NADH-quinone oxidoreductase subunit N n=1 Tax=Geoalkalibacter halelectricus TaxID=2847045 RepID=A0ABY5ZH08_9BACT|nr:NADH-quinone oxidoreductase subunit N [Geoalkalibacter halelectricus]MDO3378135.1 NADH-quinone oxidoreductase subunit N [Geoalkalibacter halelectricus]UWZ77981.1 NADH-quinone oxidoreductase subunit N [Geoalkalibacter halelectricus]